MPDYQNSKIYKLVCDNPDLIYYGSTTQTLCNRKAGHKKEFKRGKFITSYKLFETSDNIKIVLIKNYPCNNIEELHAEERKYVENNICVNKNIPGRTKKQYRGDHKDEIIEYRKRYNDANRDKILENSKRYKEKNREKILEYHKQYYKNNKEK